MNILNIPKPKKRMYLVWEHVMKTVFAMSGTFALLFFGPFLLGAKSSSRHRGDGTEELSLNIIGYFVTHPFAQLTICLVVALIVNIYIIYQNRKRKYVFTIELDENNYKIGLSNLFYRNTEVIEINKEALIIDIIQKKVENDKWTKYKIKNAQTHEIIGEIDPRHVLWSDHKKELKSAFKNLL